MAWLHIILLIVGGVLALSGLIITKKPDAKAMLDKLIPYQAVLGVALLAVSLIQMFRIGPIIMFRMLSVSALPAFTIIAGVYGGILLGFFFGMPQIAKWIPGESAAETKAMELSKRLAPITLAIGVVALAAALLMMLYEFKILK